MTDKETFKAADFRLAEQLAKTAATDSIASNLERMLPSGTPSNRVSELVWRVASVLESTKWRLAGFASSVSLINLLAGVSIRTMSIAWLQLLSLSYIL